MSQYSDLGIVSIIDIKGIFDISVLSVFYYCTTVTFDICGKFDFLVYLIDILFRDNANTDKSFIPELST